MDKVYIVAGNREQYERFLALQRHLRRHTLQHNELWALQTLMPLVTGPCKTAILQGQILAMHSSVAVGLAMAQVRSRDFPYLERKSQLLGTKEFPYTLFGEFYLNEAYNDLMFKAKRGEEVPLSFYAGKF